jgi:hypothetical protein
MGSVIYPFIKAISGQGNPNLKELENISPKESAEYLMKLGNMEGKYLGACLDSCRWGSMTTVAWDMNVRGLMSFIQKWRDENNDNEDLYHEEPIDKLYTKFELPYINHEKCPRNKKHENNFLDGEGRLRCGHRSIDKMKPSFIQEYDRGYDELSQMKIKGFCEDKPSDPSYLDDNDDYIRPEPHFSNYSKKIKKYDSEKPIEEIVDVCYAIISDKDSVLSFETILERMNLQPTIKTVYCNGDSFNGGPCRRLDELDESARRIVKYSRNCRGHEEQNNLTEFPFDGWDLAYYLLRWKQQSESPPWFAKKHEDWHGINSKKYPRKSSDD